MNLAEVAVVVGIVAGLATIVAGVVAVVTLWSVRSDSRERSRPLMVAELQMSVVTRSLVLVVRNAGVTAARDVKVSFKPVLPSGDGDVLLVLIRDRYAGVLPMVAPGAVLRNVYCSMANREPDVPTEFVVGVVYSDSRGRKYTESFSLTTSLWDKATFSTRSRSSEKESFEHIADAVERIAEAIGVR